MAYHKKLVVNGKHYRTKEIENLICYSEILGRSRFDSASLKLPFMISVDFVLSKIYLLNLWKTRVVCFKTVYTA